MPGLPRSVLLDTPLQTDPRGRWVRWDHTTKEDSELALKVEDFEPLEYPAGIEAARWLKEDALENDGMSKTRLLMTDERVEGFISMCFGTVELTGGGKKRLPVTRRLQRTQAPAFIVCWVARHRDSPIPGMQLMLTAVGLAREAKHLGGLVALALDPHDDEVAMMWQNQPWYFRKCREREDGRPARLYLPI
ncbi:MAG: hypothetical protein ACM3N0_11620 [Chloroflexota bacterium]